MLLTSGKIPTHTFRRSCWTMADFYKVQAVSGRLFQQHNLPLMFVEPDLNHIIFCWQIWEWPLVGTQRFVSSAKPLINPTITFSNSPLDFEFYCSEHNTREQELKVFLTWVVPFNRPGLLSWLQSHSKHHFYFSSPSISFTCLFFFFFFFFFSMPNLLISVLTS